MRPFTSANGTPASAVSRIRFGQISGLGEHGEIGPPMIQERARVARRVERHVLVDGARAKPPPREARRGHGARRQQETQRRKLGAEGLDQRQDRIGLADAGGVQPHEPAFGRGALAIPEPFRAPARVLLAVALAQAQQRGGERAQQVAGAAIARERQPRPCGDRGPLLRRPVEGCAARRRRRAHRRAASPPRARARVRRAGAPSYPRRRCGTRIGSAPTNTSRGEGQV